MPIEFGLNPCNSPVSLRKAYSEPNLQLAGATSASTRTKELKARISPFQQELENLHHPFSVDLAEVGISEDVARASTVPFFLKEGTVFSLIKNSDSPIREFLNSSVQKDFDKLKFFCTEWRSEGGESFLHYFLDKFEREQLVNIVRLSDEKTPFKSCWDRGYKQIISEVIKHGADINLQDNQGYSAMHKAVKYGEYHLLHLLYAKGGNVDIQTRRWLATPLHLAASKLDIKAAKILLEYKAKPNIQNSDGETPLHCAFRECLEARKDSDYSIAPEYKIFGQTTEMVELLLNNGAKASLVDHDGKNALEVITDSRYQFPSKIYNPLIEYFKEALTFESKTPKKSWRKSWLYEKPHSGGIFI